MSETSGGRLKGIPIPSSGDPKMQAFLRAVHDAFTREGSGESTVREIQAQADMDSSREKTLPPVLASPAIRFYELDSVGVIRYLPMAPAETMGVFRFVNGDGGSPSAPGVVTVASCKLAPGLFDLPDGGNVILQADFQPGPDDILLLISNGTFWYEIGRAGGVEPGVGGGAKPLEYLRF